MDISDAQYNANLPKIEYVRAHCPALARAGIETMTGLYWLSNGRCDQFEAAFVAAGEPRNWSHRIGHQLLVCRADADGPRR